MKYTLIDLKDLHYDIGLNYSEYTLITDIEEFIEDLALGIITLEQLILTDEQLSLNGNLFEDIISSDEILTIESLRETYSEKQNDNEETLEIENDIENISNENIIPNIINDENINTEEQQVTDKKLDNKTKTKQKHNSFISRLFNKKNTDIDVDIDIDTSLTSVIKTDLSRGKVFKQYLINNNYLTEEQVSYIEKEIADAQRLGEKKYFIQVCREKKIFVQPNIINNQTRSLTTEMINRNEDLCAKLLTITTSKEIISKVIIMSNIGKISELNKDLLNKNFMLNYFIYSVDHSKMRVLVCKDFTSQVNTFRIETFYPSYSVVTLDVVEGVTQEIIDAVQQIYSGVGDIVG